MPVRKVLNVRGSVVRLSSQSAGSVVLGFFLGNVLPMMVIVCYLFDSSPVRVCNAYLLDDQEELGQKLGWIAAIIGLAWFASIVRQLMCEEDLPAPSSKLPGVLET